MKLFYDGITDGIAQTHALVVGIDDYPHLEDGRLYQIDPARFPMGLGQLTSPIQSASHFARWLRSSLCNPRAPLGSVDLLLSSRSYSDSGGNSIVRGTRFDEIRAAFDEWVDRCKHPESVAIFYFCGHGISLSSRTFLLAESYGSNRNVPFDDVIDFRTTYEAMDACPAKTQLYFVDCCRTAPPQFWSVESGARPLMTAMPRISRGRDAPVFFGSLLGESATAPVGDVSHFTRAVVEALSGTAADRPDNGRWKISTSKLQGAINAAMERMDTAAGRCEQVGSTVQTSYIHETDSPRVFVTIDCDPRAALSSASLRAMDDGRVVPLERSPHPKPWQILLAAGECSAEAWFSARDYRDCKQTRIVMPPHFYWTLPVQ